MTFVAGLNGMQMFGVGHDAVVYLVEQLTGAAHCRQYKFRYQDYQPLDDDVSRTFCALLLLLFSSM